jgi:hypothetical protein
MTHILLVLLSILVPVATLAQTPVPQETTVEPVDAAPLPVRRVVLYKNGVGYFEHLGTVRNRQDVTIRFTSAQLNDVLKSLTTLDLGKGQIAGISYNSVAPLEQRLGALRLPLDQRATLFDVLSALRGARVEVASAAASVAGRLLAVERHQRTVGAATVTLETISLVTDAGDVRTFDLTPAIRVRVVDRDLRQEVSRYLDVVGSTRERDVRSMVISTVGSGERELFVSYISEVPIWKSTYRLILPSKAGKPLLQGWAIVDNTVGEDWDNVELSLVAGAPQSFIQQISLPYYGRRPVVPMPTNVLIRPQTHQATLERPAVIEESVNLTIDDVRRDALSARPQLSGPPPPPPAAPARREAGRGTVGGVVGGLPEAPYDQAANLQAAAAGAELGDLFEYRLKEPVTLKKNQSALVPIINSEVTAEKVSLWNQTQGSGRPLRAVWITNASGLTLDGGSMAIVDGNAFAGEGLIEPLKAGERRLVSYAADLGVLVRAKQEGAPIRVFRVRARDGILIHDTEERAMTTYTARNENDAPVTLVIEHRMRPGWKLAEGQTPAESTVDAQRFRLVIDPRKEATLSVRELRAGETRNAIGDLTEQFAISGFRGGGMLTEDLQRALKPVIDKRTQIAVLERQLATLNAQQQAIVSDQDRVRENMKALRGTAEEKQLLQRYTRQLDEQENRLEELRKEIAQVTASIAKAREEMSKLIAEMSFDYMEPVKQN